MNMTPAEPTPAASRLERWEAMTEWPLTGAAVAYLALYAWCVLADSDHDDGLASRVTIALWFVFALDYAIKLVLAERSITWFWRHLGELALVILPVLRPLRALRLLRVLSALQRTAGGALRGRITLYTAGGATILIVTAALAVYDAERRASEATISSFGDALWWAVTTVTTVGYGDTYPVTTEGRVIAVALMFAGIGLIGVATGTLASWIVSTVAGEGAVQDAQTQTEIRRLEDLVLELSASLAALRAEVPLLLEARPVGNGTSVSVDGNEPDTPDDSTRATPPQRDAPFGHSGDTKSSQVSGLSEQRPTESS